MKKLLKVTFTGVFLAFAWWVLCFQQRFQIPWILVAAHRHAPRGAVDCGYVRGPMRSDGNGDRAWHSVMNCASRAQKQGKPFIATFTIPYGEGDFSNAIISDGKGGGTALWYATGMAERRDMLLKTPCQKPFRFRIFYNWEGAVPRLTCVTTITNVYQMERDFLIW